MLYAVIPGALFAALYGLSAGYVNSATALPVAIVTGILSGLAIFLPRRAIQYNIQDAAPSVLSNLMRRAAVGTSLVVAAALSCLVLVNAWTNPVLLGEVYVYALIGVLLFQGVGEVMTNHVIYLQRTNQYNSNQLAAALLGMALLLVVLILYFLAFDLAQPPNLHNYLRDLLAITLILIGYGRAVYLMVRH